MRIHTWPSAKGKKILARYVARQGISTTLKMYIIWKFFTIEHMVNLSDSPSYTSSKNNQPFTGFCIYPLKNHKHRWTWCFIPPKKGHIETPCFLGQLKHNAKSDPIPYNPWDWYIYLVEFHGKCRDVYRSSHGCYMHYEFQKTPAMEFHIQNPQKLRLFSPRHGSDLR